MLFIIATGVAVHYTAFVTTYYNTWRDGNIPLRVGNCDIQLYEERVPDESFALFRDSNWVKLLAGKNLFEEDYHRYELAAPAKEVATRLELYGYGSKSIEYEFRSTKDEMREAYVSEADRHPEWSSRMQQFCADLTSTDDLFPVLAARIDGDSVAESSAEEAKPLASELIRRLLRRDPRYVLWLCAHAKPEATVVLDVSGHAPEDASEDWTEGFDGQGWCSSAVKRLAGNRAIPPVIVLTEGKTDSEFIGSAIRILRPEVADLISFLDSETKPNQSASMVAKTAIAFAAAGITNPIVALFDNDTTGRKEYDFLRGKKLPGRVVPAVLPNLPVADRYPSLLPPLPDATSVTLSNVNGFACGIEMYCGSDVLETDGQLEPVFWSSFEQGRYQGSLKNKNRVQEAYREKVKIALMDPAMVNRQDWSGMHLVIDVILKAAAQSMV